MKLLTLCFAASECENHHRYSVKIPLYDFILEQKLSRYRHFIGSTQLQFSEMHKLEVFKKLSRNPADIINEME